jgi:hypothetical protein
LRSASGNPSVFSYSRPQRPWKLLGFFLPALLLSSFVACSDTAGSKPVGGGDAGPTGPDFSAGEQIDVPVPDGQRVYVRLASPPAIVNPANPTTDKGWDLAFEGLEVYTNSGPSGSGSSLGFGPLDPVVFLGEEAPVVPFLTADKTGGAFIRWYYYEGAPNHALHSRFHVFGVRDGARQWKVQILTYYGERDGAPVAGLYKIRYAEVLAGGGSGPVQEPPNIDGTAGGPQGTLDNPSECIDFGTGARVMHTPAAARAASDWHVCFRRQDISVNGELGGPRNVAAIDFEADKLGAETLTEILNRTPSSEQAKFDAVNEQSFAGQPLRGDRVVSAFSGLWIEKGSSPPRPGNFAWLVVGANGKSNYLVGFSKFVSASATSPGTVAMSVKPVQ